MLFERLARRDQARLLKILLQQVLVDQSGNIIEVRLNSPALACTGKALYTVGITLSNHRNGSTQLPFTPPEQIHPEPPQDTIRDVCFFTL
jgi:hypothetical protein